MTDFEKKYETKRIELYKKVFQSFDKNGDAEIDLCEVCEAMGMDTDEAKKHIFMNDKDGSDTIGFNEFYLVMRTEQRKIEIRRTDPVEGRWRKSFKEYDKDNSHSIDREEFRLFWLDLEPALTEQSVSLMYAMCDLNADGEITYDEFAAMLSFLAD